MYTPHTDSDIAAMLAVTGAASLEELVRVPDAVALKTPLDVPPALPEMELARKMSGYAARNAAVGYRSFAGAGAYRHYVPPVVMSLAMRGEFLTAYTPYQAEVSQGYLQAIYEWQTYVCLLTGLDIANASVYDGATALAEAAIMAVNATGRRAILVSAAVHPNYRAVLRTYAAGMDLDVDELPLAADGTTDLRTLEARLADGRYAAVALQSPNFFGAIDVPGEAARALLAASGTVPIAVVAEALSLGALAIRPASGGPDRSGRSAVVRQRRSLTAVRTSASSPRRTNTCAAFPAVWSGGSLDNRGRTAYVLTLAGARAAHPARKSDLEHLHQSSPLRARRDDLSGRTRRDGSRALRGAEPRAHAASGRTGDFALRVSSAPSRRRSSTSSSLRVPEPMDAAGVLSELQARGILGGVDLGRWYPRACRLHPHERDGADDRR